MKVSETVCKHGQHNMRSYLFLNMCRFPMKNPDLVCKGLKRGLLHGQNEQKDWLKWPIILLMHCFKTNLRNVNQFFKWKHWDLFLYWCWYSSETANDRIEKRNSCLLLKKHITILLQLLEKYTVNNFHPFVNNNNPYPKTSLRNFHTFC